MTDPFDAATQSPDLQALRRQARQRFIGAAVLVLIAVIALPFVLDTKPRPVSSNIAIEIQSPQPEPTKPADPLAAPVLTTAPVPAAAPTPAPAVVPAPAIAPAEQPTAPPLAFAKPDHEKVETQPSAKVDDGARAAALLNGSGYHIQAGSFSDKTKASEVQAKLKKAGFPNFTQEAIARDGSAHTRIRIGPYASQAEANRVAARIAKLGIKTIVIKP